MSTPAQAVLAIRHVVQDHGDAHTVIRGGAHLAGIVWFGQLLGWQWPPSYLEVLGKHEGVQVGDAIIFSFLQSFEVFMRLHDVWQAPCGYWPVASDGCGNSYALSLSRSGANGECPVVFFEMIESRTEPLDHVADTYAGFVLRHMARECERAGCSALRSHGTNAR